MACRPNTHRPSFHVNMVGLEKTQRSKSSRFPWDLGAEMMDEDDEFELWFQQALASGLFCEPSKRRKSWSPFKMHQKKGKQQWRRWSWMTQVKVVTRKLTVHLKWKMKRLPISLSSMPDWWSKKRLDLIIKERDNYQPFSPAPCACK